MKRRFVLACVVAVAAAAVLACDDKPGQPSGTGTLSMMVKDTPFADAKAVLVTFSEVRAHLADADWQTVPFASATSRTCDLKKLQGAQDVLGVGTLPAGHYTQVRLTVSSATLYFDHASEGPACAPTIAPPADRNAPLTISSGTVILNRQFEVPTGGATTIVLDFDGDKSINETGNGTYRMSPVISIVSVQ